MMGTCTFTGNISSVTTELPHCKQRNQNPREQDNLGYHWDQKWRQETRDKTQPMTVLHASSHMIQDYQTIFPKRHKNPVKEGKFSISGLHIYVTHLFSKPHRTLKLFFMKQVLQLRTIWQYSLHSFLLRKWGDSRHKNPKDIKVIPT